MKPEPVVRWIVWHSGSFTAHIGPNEGAAWQSLKIGRGMNKDTAIDFGWHCTRVTLGGEAAANDHKAPLVAEKEKPNAG